MHNRMNDLLNDDVLPPPRHGLPVPADARDVHPDDADLIVRLRRQVRAMKFEPLTDYLAAGGRPHARRGRWRA